MYGYINKYVQVHVCRYTHICMYVYVYIYILCLYIYIYTYMYSIVIKEKEACAYKTLLPKKAQLLNYDGLWN